MAAPPAHQDQPPYQRPPAAGRGARGGSGVPAWMAKAIAARSIP